MTEYQRAIENSFMILSGKATLEGICLLLTFQLEGRDMPAEFPMFFIEPGIIPDTDQIDTMIEYFEYREEYEKCAWLSEYKKKL